MVKLEEVLDEEFTQDQKGPDGGEEDWDTDTGTYILALANRPHSPSKIDPLTLVFLSQTPSSPQTTKQNPTLTKPFLTASSPSKMSCHPNNASFYPTASRRRGAGCSRAWGLEARRCGL